MSSQIGKKRDSKHLDDDSHDLTSDTSNKFFDVLVKASMESPAHMQYLIETCRRYGEEHGDTLRKKIDASNSYAKKYQNQRRAPSKISEEAIPQNSSSTTSNNPYVHPFYKMYHSNKSHGNNGKDIVVPSSSTSSAAALPSPPSTSSNKRSQQTSSTQVMSVLVPGMKGVEQHTLPNKAVQFVAFVTILGRQIKLGDYPREREAQLAHDRALLRALGPVNCNQDQLNMPISSYAKDALESFMRHDAVLKRALFGTSWDGVKDCDFGFLLAQLMKSPTLKKQKKTPLSASNKSNETASLTSHSAGGTDVEA